MHSYSRVVLISGLNTQEEQLQGLSNGDLLQAIWRINSLQRSLSIMALTWASCLHDAAAAALPIKQRPKLLTSVISRPSGGAGAGVPQVRCLIGAMKHATRCDRRRQCSSTDRLSQAPHTVEDLPDAGPPVMLQLGVVSLEMNSMPRSAEGV